MIILPIQGRFNLWEILNYILMLLFISCQFDVGTVDRSENIYLDQFLYIQIKITQRSIPRKTS